MDYELSAQVLRLLAALVLLPLLAFGALAVGLFINDWAGLALALGVLPLGFYLSPDRVD